MRELPNELNKAPRETVYLAPENASFAFDGSFLTLRIAEHMEGFSEKAYARVTLRRAFPFDQPWRYIFVSDRNDREIGMIADVADFDAETEKMLREELERFYYTPRIRKILSLKERAGFSYWEVKTDEEGTVSFTVQDTFRNLLRIGEDRAAVFDVDGNRFEIDSIAALDKKSYKKIELYL